MSRHPTLTPPVGLSTTPNRRLSYATVAAAASNMQAPVFGRSGPYPVPPANSSSTSLQQPQAAREQTTHTSRATMDMDGQGSYVGERPRRRLGCTLHEDHPPVFTPSYLKRSRHVQRLHRAHEEHMAELLEKAGQELPSPSQQPLLSAPTSNANLGKMHASHIHRPTAVQDVIERLPPATDDDRTHPMPSRWNGEDCMNGLEVLAEGTEVRFNGVSKNPDEAASIRADYPIPRECGIYYFEVTVLSKGKDGLIGVGFSTKKANLNRAPGWETESWAYHGDDGYSFACTASGKAYGPKFSSQDVVGCGVNFRTGNAFFTKNGVYLGTAFTGIKGDRLFPSVGMKKPGEHLRINFGRTPFVFDIDRLMEQERQTVLQEIKKADVSSLHTPDNEDSLVHKLIGQYLAHEGYVDTAKAFANDLQNQQLSLAGESEAPQLPETDDDIHAINRQKIRKSILDGDIDRALKYTGTYYPHVMEEERNRDIYFRLRCRKFIEMMRRSTELAASTASPSNMSQSIDSLRSNGNGNGHKESHVINGSAVDEEDEATDTQMELDDQLQRETPTYLEPHTDDVDMDASQELPSKALLMRQNELMTAALSYGQELQHEFGSDPRPHIKTQLQDLFAIIAYDKPADSPIGGLLDTQGRVSIAEEVNGAILVSLDKPPSAALEKLCAQTEALLDEVAAKTGGAAALINVKQDFLQP